VALGETNENCQVESRLSDPLQFTDANINKAVLLCLFLRRRQLFLAYCIKTCIVLLKSRCYGAKMVAFLAVSVCLDIDRTNWLACFGLNLS
jgi:hypothetical protein